MQLGTFVVLLYTPIRQHRLLESIDTALCAGDFEKLSKLCYITQYTKQFKASNEDCSGGSLEDGTSQPIRLQQPSLPDLEPDMHVEYAELIADVDLLMMQSFPAAAASGCFRERSNTIYFLHCKV